MHPEICPKREAQIWRMVLEMLLEWESPERFNQAYVCTLLTLLQRRRQVSCKELGALKGFVEDLLGFPGPLASLQRWLVATTGATPDELHERDPGLHNTRIQWVTWLIKQAEERAEKEAQHG